MGESLNPAEVEAEVVDHVRREAGSYGLDPDRVDARLSCHRRIFASTSRNTGPSET
jgi:hypothetical protein